MYECSVPDGNSTGGIEVISTGIFSDVSTNQRNGRRLNITKETVIAKKALFFMLAP
jgi:hypothetical protein